MTEEQKQRQDVVDNAIFELVCALCPLDEDKLEASGVEWDIELIGEIRDVVRGWFVERLGICTDEEFYPSVAQES